MADEDPYILRMENISKTFPGVNALENVSFKVRKGTVHALMGENGAGKSTLMKILVNMIRQDSGDIYFKGVKRNYRTIHEALSSGISMIHQELSAVPDMTVAENIFLGREPKRMCFVDEGKQAELTRGIFRELDMAIDPKIRMSALSTSYVQMVEIAKAISCGSDLIIMDEPTSAITDKEVATLFRVIRSLVERGISVVYITHKMDEVFQISDDITVLRDGKWIDTKPAAQLDKGALIRLMVGRELTQLYPKRKGAAGEVVLSIRDFSRKGEFSDINMEIRKGEILGIAGLMGAGRSELVSALFGVTRPDSGKVIYKGKEVKIRSTRDSVRIGMGLITEDRKLTGLFLPLSIQDNMTITSIDAHATMGLLKERAIKKKCATHSQRLNIRMANLQQHVSKLSGGNQQKVIIARWLMSEPEILIVDEPTRGIDIGAKFEIHKLLCDLADSGHAVVIISSEMPEILGMADRIHVMHEGRFVGELTREEATQEKIMEFAVNAHAYA